MFLLKLICNRIVKKTLSNCFRLKPGLFAYAGTKDKRAKTSQEITLYR